MSRPDATELEIRLGRLVLAAAALETREREAFLAEATSEDPELLAEARRLLDLAADTPSTFLAGPAELTAETLDRGHHENAAAGGEPPPDGGERYAIGPLLGRGGMARVYRAIDRQLDRPVALKFLDRGDPALLERFQREARTQAKIRHDHVLEVYETGELSGRPYIAMRFVDGPTLGQLGGLPLEQKLRLFADIAEGLHAAHRAGLLHRDVKPSNILVESREEGETEALKPYVADFGIASQLDPEATLSGVLAGTPLYMAPERIRGEASIDRRSDVYSLGVTMYRLLTGEVPFTDASPVLFLKEVLETPPRPPRELVPGLPPDVEAIVLKCLAKDPAQRYASARAVAEDLRRFLNGEVVEAHAASLAHRLSKLALRHRRLLPAAAVALGLLLVALAVAAVSGVAAMAANERADARRGQAEGLIDFMLRDLRAKLESVGRLEILDDVGEEAMAYFAAVPPEELTDDELSRRSRALYQIGEVRIRQGDLSAAGTPLAEALALSRELVRREPENGERLFELGQSHFWVGFVHWRQGELEKAQGPFEDYLDVSRRLVEMDPENLDWRLELAYAHSNLGSLLESRGRLREALEQFRTTLAIDEDLVARDPANDAWRFELGATHNTVGVALLSMAGYEEARKHFRTDLAIRRHLLETDPKNRSHQEFLGTSHHYLGNVFLPLGRPTEARRHARQALAIFEELTEHDPENADWRFKLAISHFYLGRAELARGDLDAAEAAFSHQQDLVEKLVEGEPEDRQWRRHLGIVRYHRGLLQARRGDSGGAEEHLLAALEALDSAVGSRPGDRFTPRWLAKSYLLLGRLAAWGRRPAAATKAWERSLAVLGASAATSDDAEALAVWTAATFLLDRPDEARRAALRLAAVGYRDPGFADPVALSELLGHAVD